MFSIEHPYLQIPAVALLSLLDVTVPTLLSSVEHLHLRHVKQTHAHAFLQTRRQILLTTRTEDRGEREPETTYTDVNKVLFATISAKRSC